MLKKLFGALLSASAMVLLGALPSSAAGGYSLFGDATLTSGNNSPTGVQLRSVGVTTFGGIDFAVPAGMTFSQVQNLATDYNFTDNSCGGGSPRFQVNVTAPTGTKNVFIYIGPPPNYTNCPQNIWLNSGNLMTPANLIDTSQLPGGTFYDPVAAAQLAYGSYPVTGIQLVVDAGWAFPSPADETQVVVVDNVQINGTTYTFESAASCKQGGWQNFTSAPGPFKNQGDCVSFFESGGKNS
jgi:hypothetical protein